MPNVLLKTYTQLPGFDRREILRYAGYRGEADEGTAALLDECLMESANAFDCRVAYLELPIETFYAEFTGAEGLRATRLQNAERVVVFAATVGLGIDRLTARYASVSTAKALLFQAIGAERVEALCDCFCEELLGAYRKKGFTLLPRFSPGYGAFPLTAQRDMFRLLDCSRKIGVSLQESLLMTPTKSVTAVVAIQKEEK